jgi:hypothetical protein
MKINDFNGEDKWSRDAILERYNRYCRELGIDPSDLSPYETIQGDTKWIYPVMDEVIRCIDLGDAACKLIGIEFIEEDQGFSFGRILKANTARAIRRQNLSEEDKNRIRKRVIHMLVEGNIPREYREYARLLKKVGLADYRETVEKCAKTENPYVLKFAKYLLD